MVRLIESDVFRLIGRVAVLAFPAIALPLLTYMLNEIVSLRVSVSVLQQSLMLQTTDRYRAADAARDFQIRDITIRALDARVDALESRMNKSAR